MLLPFRNPVRHLSNTCLDGASRAREGGGGVLDIVHGRSRMTIDPRMRTYNDGTGHEGVGRGGGPPWWHAWSFPPIPLTEKPTRFLFVTHPISQNITDFGQLIAPSRVHHPDDLARRFAKTTQDHHHHDHHHHHHQRHHNHYFLSLRS